MLKSNEITIKKLLPPKQFVPTSDKDIDKLLSEFLDLYDWGKIQHARISVVHVSLESNFMFYGLTDEEQDTKIIHDDEIELYPLSGQDVFDVLNKYELMQQWDTLHASYFGVLEKGNETWEFFVLFICTPGKKTYNEYIEFIKHISDYQGCNCRQYEASYSEQFVHEHSNANGFLIDNNELSSMIIKNFYEKINERSIHGDQADDKRFIICRLNKNIAFRKLLSEQLEGPIQTTEASTGTEYKS